MGRSIAACLVAAGHHVTGVAHNLETSASVPERIRVVLEQMAAEGLLTESIESVIERFRLTADLADIATAELVVESITEDLNVKRELLQRVEQVVAPQLHRSHQHLGNPGLSAAGRHRACGAGPGPPLG
jgi:3-hydroxybutyryl-CoA dehydrogenase